MTFYRARIAPLSYKYVISKDGEPAYVARIEPGELVFTDPEEREAFRVEDRFPVSVEGVHLIDSKTDQLFGRVIDEIALLGRRWTIRDEEDNKVATIRDRGKFRALLYHIGLETTLPLPTVMEILRPSGQPIGTVRRKVGAGSTITIELDSELGFDQRLALGAALMLDQDDRQTRELYRRLGND